MFTRSSTALAALTALTAAAVLAGLLAPIRSAADGLPRAIVTDFANTSRDRHTTTARSAGDAVAVELDRRGVYEVLPTPQVDRAARRLGLRRPYSDVDASTLARELQADVVVSGDVAEAAWRSQGKQREMQVGLIVRVRDAAGGELVNGAAEWGSAADPPDGSKTEGSLLIDAASSAATRAVARIGAYQPLTGTVLSASGYGGVVLNRGAEHGVRARQEFVLVRDGARVGRARAKRVSGSYTELTITDSTSGVRPEDRAVAVFGEPKLTRPR